MKKILLVFVCFILVFAGTFAANASSNLDPELEEILNSSLEEQMPEKYMEILHNTELYYENGAPDDPDYMDNPILDLNKRMSVVDSGGKPFDELLGLSVIAVAKPQVIVLGDDVREVRISKEGDLVVFVEPYTEETMPSFVADILTLKKNVVLCGQECELNRILCIDNSTSHFGIVVFLQTDKGVFVRYYPLPDSECMEMTQQEYAAYCYAWDAYIKSLPPDTGGTAFTSFMTSKDYSEVKDFAPPLEDLYPKKADTPDEKPPQTPWLIPAGIAIVCVVGAGLAVLIWKKKKV